MPPRLISNPADVTTDWLNQVLMHAGSTGRVDDFTANSIGTGQVGENVRFALEGTDVPASLVGKFPSADEVSRQTGIAQKNYLREVFFYNQIQGTVDIQTPKVLFAEVDEETHNFVIMMEDLAPGVQGDQLAGCSADEAALALEELAKLQGPRWGDPALLDYPLLVSAASSPNDLKMIYQMLEPGFAERYASRLTGDEHRMVHQVGEVLERYNNIYQAAPGLIHIDFRLDNMMFGGPYPLAVVDWQSLSTGCPIADVSYFLGTSLAPELRQKEERHLLRHYLDRLKSYGVQVREEECLTWYRNYAPAGLIMAVIASMIVGETERGNDMFMAMGTRSAQMCRDLDSIKLIRQG